MNAAIEDQLRRAILTIRSLKREAEELRAELKPAIAVIGMGCRLPDGADSPTAFWQMLLEGRDAIVEVPTDRWDVDAWYDPDPDVPGRMNTRWGGFLSGIDRFDAEFFELSAREAAGMDPQQRLLLEVAWEALEDAQLAADRLRGSATGVYIGINAAEYYQMALAAPATLDAHTLSGGVASVAAGRLSYLLGFNGPSVAVDTACSSSLTAVHLAIQSLRTGESRMALAGGVYTVLQPELTVGLSRLHMMAADGRCKSFDAAADGFVQGEGCALVVLKRLADALADGDPIQAVIRGSAMNQDGRSGSLTAPSRSAQVQVIQAALRDAGLSPERIGYVETHGTGTALGDPIELHALADALGRDRQRPVVLGAVKTQIGHLGPAAGIAGLVKAVLAVRHSLIPPNLHFRTLNPNIQLDGFPAVFPQAPTAWPKGEGPRTAGVSSFGFSGTNVHLVVEEAPLTPNLSPPAGKGSLAALCLSARDEAALTELRLRYLDILTDEADFPAICRTAALGRRHFEYRLAVVAESAAEARGLLVEATPVRIATRPRDHSPVVPALATLDEPRALLKTAVTRYVYGLTVDWAALLGPGPRAPVPTYPFQRRRYWRSPLQPLSFGGKEVGSEGSGLRQEIAWPPGTRLLSPTREAQFQLLVGLDRFPWLGDHRVQGLVLVPGAFQIACLLGAWQSRHGFTPCQMAWLVFARPLIVPEAGHVAVWTLLAPDGNARLVSPDGDAWVEHAEALITSVAGFPAERTNLDALRRRCVDPVPPGVWRDELETLGITIGPAFQGIRRLWRSPGEALAEVVLPPGLPIPDGVLHPALLDACLQVAGGAIADQAQGHALLPVGIDRIDIVEIPTGPVWVHARRTRADTVISADLDLLDATGCRLMQIQGLHVKRAPQNLGRVDPIADWFYRVEWIDQRPLPIAELTASRLILVADPAIGFDLTRRLDGQNRIVTPAFTLTQMASDHWQAPPEAIGELVDRLGDVTTVIDLHPWALAESGNYPGASRHPTLAREGNDEETCQRALSVIRSLLAAKGRPALWFITQGAVLETPQPGQAALWGLGATLALEHPEFSSRCLDADHLDSIARELSAAPSTPEAAILWRQGQRRVPRLVRTRPSWTVAPPTLRGTVLITGAFGGLGRQVAGWAVGRGAEQLVLVGRHADSPEARAFAESFTVPVHRVVVDVSRCEEVERLMAGLADLPPLRSIFHLAGTQSPGLLADLDWADVRAALDAKATGAWWFHRATLGQSLDHFVLFSSMASVLGAAGQGGYAAANARLDALARHRRSQGLPAVSIAWGRWAGAGMADELDAAALQRIEALGLVPMPTELALVALDRSLVADEVNPLIADIDWNRYRQRHPSGRPPALLERLDGPTMPPPPEVRLHDQLTELPEAERGAVLLDGLIKETRRVLGLAVDRSLDIHRPLIQLGLDSLLAVELRNRIRVVLGNAPSIAVLLGGSSLAELAAVISPSPSPSAPLPPAGEGSSLPSADADWEELSL
jgi:acyl transferase domain-containing protein